MKLAPWVASLAVSAALAASPAAGELAAWDQARVRALAEQLAAATGALYDAVWKQPQPATPLQRRDYYRMRQEVRHLKNEARHLSNALAKGAGPEETLPGYEDLLSSARWASQRARSVFITRDVDERANAVRSILNQLAPYYDPDAPGTR